jgi:hypothetical protein
MCVFTSACHSVIVFSFLPSVHSFRPFFLPFFLFLSFAYLSMPPKLPCGAASLVLSNTTNNNKTTTAKNACSLPYPPFILCYFFPSFFSAPCLFFFSFYLSVYVSRAFTVIFCSPLTTVNATQAVRISTFHISIFKYAFQSIAHHYTGCLCGWQYSS